MTARLLLSIIRYSPTRLADDIYWMCRDAGLSHQLSHYYSQRLSRRAKGSAQSLAYPSKSYSIRLTA